MDYAAYLRVYEPVSAFHEPDRSCWMAYAESGTRPRRRDALAAEQLAALRRLIANERPAVEHAYVRFADGLVYVCPWQIDERGDCAQRPAGSARWYIQTSGWTVPLAWFFPFTGAERWIALGRGTARVQGAVGLRATAHATRTLVYVATMTQARRRVTRGVATLRALERSLREREATAAGYDLTAAAAAGVRGDGSPRLAAGVRGDGSPRLAAGVRGDGSPRLAAGVRGDGSPRLMEALTAMDELAGLGRWLERFHPRSLVELDYGGLVHLLSDTALCGDESVAEVGAVVAGMSRGHFELAHAMYRRVRARWLMFREFEQVN